MRVAIVLFSLLPGLTAVITAVSIAATSPAMARITDNGVYGLWLVGSKRAAVEITPCEKAPDALCGHVVWIIEGGLTIDKHNPKKDLRNRPICGLRLLRGFERDAPGEYSGGKIYDAKEGKTYKATIKVKDADTLFLRGYVGIPLFGRSQEWTRLPDDHERCTPPVGASNGKAGDE